MIPIDFHTHKTYPLGTALALTQGVNTWGIHPWQADIPTPLPHFDSILAIGECGLDALRGPSMDIQQTTFLQQIRLSEQLGKPLIIHCVKALDTLLQIHRRQQPSQPWILHGFRGKPQQMQSLLSRGFYISFGFLHNADSLRACPPDRLLLETDDDPRPIHQLYDHVSHELGLSADDLLLQMNDNFRHLFTPPFTPLNKKTSTRG